MTAAAGSGFQALLLSQSRSNRESTAAIVGLPVFFSKSPRHVSAHAVNELFYFTPLKTRVSIHTGEHSGGGKTNGFVLMMLDLE